VIASGLLTTVQDLGRRGHARFGVAPGGALDRAALILGNRLLGNEPGEAALEITLAGPTLAFTADRAIALTGADLGARLNGQPISHWQPIAIRAGDELRFDPSKAGPGARVYLCVAGGIAVEPVLDSRSTDLIGGFGGWQGRALRAGDRLALGSPCLPVETILRRRLATPPPTIETNVVARVVLGPQQDRFTDAGVAAFLGDGYAVSAKSNRQGIRLSGPVIEHSRGADLVSEGIAHGAVQVPGDGQPIVLLAARQTVGGYVKIATVAGADLDRLAQLRPHDRLRFEETSVAEARAALLEYRANLEADAVVHVSKAHPGYTIGTESLAEEIELVAGSWDPDGVIRVIDAIQRAGVTSFALEVEGVNLRLRRDGGGDLLPDKVMSTCPSASAPSRSDSIEVVAPVLGVFYRKSAPDQPPLVEIGQLVEQGQTICLLEVMKTYHEVTAPEAGTISAFLVEDGQFVEYGQMIARIER
jgi:antagonist of KipI